MISRLRVTCGSLLLAILGAGLASAQSFDFTLLLTANGTADRITNDSTVNVSANVGSQTTVTIVATYVGGSAATITAPQPAILGSTEFTSAYVKQTPPIVLTFGQSFSFTVTYAPTNPSQASAQVSIPYTEPGTTSATVSNAIILLFTGSSPSFTLSYILQPDNNVVQIASGQAIPFPATKLNTTDTAQLNFTNTGSGPGTITAISISASSVFKISGSPLFPATVAAGSTLFIDVLYTPTAVQNDTAQVTITYQDGTTSVVNLTGSGATSTFTYTYILGGTTTAVPVSPGGTITLAPANVTTTTGTTAASSTAIVQVTNTGSASGTISSISISGPGFGFVTPPTTSTLAPGGTISFTISYIPTAIGTQTGTLVVGSDVFTLSSKGLGPQLSFSYAAAGTTVAVGSGGAVNFPPIAVSQSEKITFTVTNTGTSTATISLIAATGTAVASAFSVTPPALPLNLLAGQSTSFPITFTPTTTGPISGTLLINNTNIPLLGSGDTPPTLPSYTISGPSGTVLPASQAQVALTLAGTYPVDLTGVLTLTTSSSVGTDSSVQFSTGGRTVDFVIPAGSTNANFAGQGSDIFVQTGTVAETVTLTPSFATPGDVDITPTSPTTLQFTIASAAPVLESIQLTNETSSSFTIVLVGYSTTRSLGTLTVTFTAASGYKLPTSQFSTDLGQQANTWFESSTAQTFGGQFQIAVPINLSGTVPNNQVLIGSLASVAATVTNSVGTSNSLMSPVP